MEQIKQVIFTAVVILIVFCLWSGNQWQKEKYQEDQQRELRLFETESGLFDIPWTFEQDMPEKIKRERCKSDRECYKLSEALVYEARGESYVKALAVASVVMNRRDHKNFPNTIWEVITQPYQFSYLLDKHRQRQPSAADWDRALVIAYDVKNGIVERVTDATFYLNPKAVKRMPRWTLEYEYVMTVDNHKFYRYP